MFEIVKLPYAESFIIVVDGYELADSRKGHYGAREFPTYHAAFDFAAELFGVR
jgi:hypothetical protein